MINFPVTPTVGQSFTDPTSHLQWVWDGTKWVATGIVGAPFLPLAGGTLGGLLTAPGISSPQSFGNNKIINGDMAIDQRNAQASGSVSGYILDRWSYAGTVSGIVQWQSSGPTENPSGFPFFLALSVLTAHTALATEAFTVSQCIEGINMDDLMFGSSTAQPVTLSFWVSTNITGTYSGSLCSAVSPYRSYPFTFSVPASNVWTKIAITIPGDTVAGTWTGTGSNSPGMFVRWDLGSGANYRAPAGAWQTGNFIGANGAVSLIGNAGAGFALTGVKLEAGSVATPYILESYTKRLLNCQRYFWAAGSWFLGLTTTNLAWSSASTIPFPTLMRATPTMSGSFSASSGSAGTPNPAVLGIQFVALNNSASNWNQGDFAATILFTGQFDADF
jgi:hypothetical protein